MTQYGRGYAFERKTRLALVEAGWFVVRSAGSKGACDLVGFKGRTHRIFVQCKRGKLPRPEWGALVALADAHDAIPVLADQDGLWYLCTHPQKWKFDPKLCGSWTD